jgi:hypothetical protein
MMARMSMRRKGSADGVDEIFAAIANDGFEGDDNADLVELLRQVEGVGVLTEGGEHLGADGDDFGFHKGRLQITGDRLQVTALSQREQAYPVGLETVICHLSSSSVI